MDPKYLLKDELEFELACRGVYSKSVVTVLKKMLTELLYTEQSGESSYKIKCPRHVTDNPTSELTVCASKINILTQYIQEITDKPDKSLFRRLVSRLYHVLNRLNLIVLKTDEDEKRQKDLKKSTEELLAKLEEHDEALDEGNLTVADKKMLQETLGEVGNIIISKIEKTSADVDLPAIKKPSMMFRASTFDDNGIKRKLVPISQWGVKFSGDISYSVNAFIERVNELKDARNATDEDLWRCAIDFFQGDALIWYRANKDSVTDWDELVILLKRTFQSPFYQDELLREIHDRTQGMEESVTVYVAVMQNMFKRLPVQPPEREKIYIILKNLQPYFQRAICRDEFNSIPDLINVLRIVDRTKVNCERFQEPVNFKSNLEPDLAYKKTVRNEVCEIKEAQAIPVMLSSNRRCWNCRELGHTFRGCKLPKQRLFCFKCGRFGTTSPNCTCMGNEQGESSRTAK